MTIQSQDIKIFASDTMSDVDEGGGAITGSQIIDGLSNNIFEDVSTLDRVYGGVKMRKVFPAVYTTDQDKYFGAHVIISKLPGDEKLGINLFNTEDWFDRRPVAQSRVENYRAKGANYTGFLFATQYKGSKIVTIFQSESAPIPGIGEVLYLTQLSETQVQYIKIVDLEHRVQEFTDAQGTFRRRILELEISQPLNYDFVGAQISRLDTLNPQATIKQTVVANAAKYYSARPLAAPATLGATTLRVDTVYSQVIPSSLQELAITDADINGTTRPIIESSSADVSLSISNNFGPNLSFYLGSPVVPGTFSFASGGSTIVDVGGTLKSGATSVGSINYAEGSFTFLATAPTYTGTKIVTFRPAAAPVQVADTASEAIDDTNRGLVYTFTIDPPPQPGSVHVSYRSLGEWYDIYDDGNGKLAGLEEGIGTGTINYSTGTLSVTLAALPDDGSTIIYSWGKKARYFNRSNMPVQPFKFQIQLAHQGIAPTTLAIDWIDAQAQTRTATANILGTISGDATGEINHATGLIELRPNALPLQGTQFNISYQYGDPLEMTFNAPTKNGNGDLVLDLGVPDLVPGSIEMTWNVDIDAITYATEQEFSRQDLSGFVTKGDNGSGGIKDIAGSSVNYTSGVITFDPDVTRSVNTPQYKTVYTGRTYVPVPNGFGGVRYRKKANYAKRLTGIVETPVPAFFPQDGSGSVTVRYRSNDSANAISTSVSISQLQIDLTDGFDETVVPGSVRFKLGGSWYIDRQGQLFSDIDPTTGSGIFSGTLDYGTGVATITSWPDAANTITLESLMTERGRVPVDSVIFRIPQSPVRPNSLQLRATQLDGTLISVVSGDIGEIEAAGMYGGIDYDSGVVTVEFGDMVDPTGYEGEDWYNPAAIDAETGKILKPTNVLAETMLYNAVSQTFLPLDSDILGLDPVRLPQDGRIPVYYDGDVIVVLHDDTVSGTYTNGQTVDLGRPRLAKVVVRDAGGSDLLPSAYTADLDNGEITFNDLSGVSQPLTITHRIEDMVLLTDVQITGTLTLSQPLSHDFPAGETLVSNAVVYGDLYARTSIPFDQQTWTNVWSDTLIGNSVAAQYNNTQYPIQVNNASAIQEKWALIFTSTGAVNVIGQSVGQILSAVSIGADIAPINPNTGQPYFTIPAAGWGGGWATGNVLRFNTFAANSPVWIIQSIGQGTATDDDLSFTLEFRGDIDTP